jgi:hypothetical protein
VGFANTTFLSQNVLTWLHCSTYICSPPIANNVKRRMHSSFNTTCISDIHLRRWPGPCAIPVQSRPKISRRAPSLHRAPKLPRILTLEHDGHAIHYFITAMPPRTIPRAPIAVRSAQGGPRALPRCLCQSQRRWASEEAPKKKGKPPPMTQFRVSLFESMGQRIERERKMLESLVQYERRTAWGNFSAMLFRRMNPAM